MTRKDFEKTLRQRALIKILRVLVEGKDNTREFLSNARQNTDLDVPDYEEIVDLHKWVDSMYFGIEVSGNE